MLSYRQRLRRKENRIYIDDQLKHIFHRALEICRNLKQRLNAGVDVAPLQTRHIRAAAPNVPRELRLGHRFFLSQLLDYIFQHGQRLSLCRLCGNTYLPFIFDGRQGSCKGAGPSILYSLIFRHRVEREMPSFFAVSE